MKKKSNMGIPNKPSMLFTKSRQIPWSSKCHGDLERTELGVRARLPTRHVKNQRVQLLGLRRRM
jgi:hypothetical protein